jgi:phosphoserine phosphatase
VCLDEGIDELAEFCGAGKAVAEWTARLNFLNGNSFLEKGLCFFLISVVFSIYDI